MGTYEEMRVCGVRQPWRPPTIAPLVRTTRPSIAAAPIPNADHEKPAAAVTTRVAGANAPRRYFLFSASLRITNARYAVAVIPCGAVLVPAQVVLLVQRLAAKHQRPVRGRSHPLRRPAVPAEVVLLVQRLAADHQRPVLRAGSSRPGFDVAACAGPARNDDGADCREQCGDPQRGPCEMFTLFLLRLGDRPMRSLHKRAEAAKRGLVRT